MSLIHEIRKLFQHLIVSDLKEIETLIDSAEETSKLRDAALSAKIDSKLESMITEMDANHVAIMKAITH